MAGLNCYVESWRELTFVKYACKFSEYSQIYYWALELRNYPLEIYAGKNLIWNGETERSLG